MYVNPLHAIDWYKASHKPQYPLKTQLVYSNFTARSNHLSNLPNNNDGVVFFSLQNWIQDRLIDDWNNNFFNQPKAWVIAQYKRRHKNALGEEPDTTHLEKLHDLGYLPIEIRALPEGTFVPIGVPMLTIKNTHPDFFWLTNYLESDLSAGLWKGCTSATTARFYQKLCTVMANETCDNHDHLPFQCHDFSYRGMGGLYDGAVSGAGHLTSFAGTDSVPAIDLVEENYFANSDEELVGVSVPATEHSVMSMGTMEREVDTFKRLISEIHPEGIVSIVSDTWDFWQVITEYTRILEHDIRARTVGNPMSKVVFRPDSGDPVKIICGDLVSNIPHVRKGAIESLWEVFGGTINSKGYRVLDPCVGLIYGDSITPQRAEEILFKLAQKGFASSNIVFGVGSFTYTYVTRDTYGFAVKATAGIVDGEYRAIFKDPKTDSGTKKSLRGFLGVYKDDQGNLRVLDDLDTEPRDDLLEVVFKDGDLLREQSLEEIRALVKESL